MTTPDIPSTSSAVVDTQTMGERAGRPDTLVSSAASLRLVDPSDVGDEVDSSGGTAEGHPMGRVRV